ncbi:MAG: aspartyl protease family protein [Acidobacteria bacterium]|nr:aspartyl protease family protein [Acidobacteriota bacterium]
MMDAAPVERLHRAVSAVDWRAAAKAIVELDDLGRHRDAALGRVLVASRRRDDKVLRAISASAAGMVLRERPETRRELALALYRTLGIASAREDLAALAAMPASGPLQSKVLALAALAEAVGDRPINQLQPGSESVVPFVEGTLLPTIPVSIDHHPAEPFIVDTGAPTTLISRGYSDKAGIRRLAEGDSALSGSGRRLPISPAIVNRITIGEMSFTTCPVQVADFPEDLGVKGVLSPGDTLRTVTAALDFGRRTFQIAAHGGGEGLEQDAGGRADLVWDEGNPFVGGTVNGRIAGYFLFDSGAGADIVTPAVAARLGKHPADRRLTWSPTMMGQAEVWSGFSGTLAVAESPAVPAEFLIKAWHRDPSAIAPIDCSGYVGVSWMRGRRVILARGGREIRFSL